MIPGNFKISSYQKCSNLRPKVYILSRFQTVELDKEVSLQLNFKLQRIKPGFGSRFQAGGLVKYSIINAYRIGVIKFLIQTKIFSNKSATVCSI